MKFIIPILFLTTALFASCTNSIKEVEEVVNKSEAFVEVGKDISMIFSETGEVKVKLNAPTVKRHLAKKPFTEFPNGLEVHFYNDSLETDTKLTANYGKRNDITEEFLMEGNVIVSNSLGEQLNTEELNYDRKKKQLTTDKFVKIRTESQIIFGEGMTANENFTSWEILNITDSYYILEDNAEYQ